MGDAPSRDGWQTIEFQGVRIDIPPTWERLDTGDCARHGPRRHDWRVASPQDGQFAGEKG